MKESRPDQFGCVEITSVPMKRGSASLCAVMGWHSRKVLGGKLSNTMDTTLCLVALSDEVSSSGGLAAGHL
jgi:putative transposase